MPSAIMLKQQTATGEFQQLADEIIADAVIGDEWSHHQRSLGQKFSSTPAQLLRSLHATAVAADGSPVCQSLVETSGPETMAARLPDRAQSFLNMFASPQTAECRTPSPRTEPAPSTQTGTVRQNSVSHLPGQCVRFGPHEIRPACGHEMPFGRDYQPIPYNSVSRLAGYIGLDEHSLYIREVPDAPEYGLRPSRNGIWVRQPHEKEYRRLAPGEAERINTDTYIRVGGNGVSADSGLPVVVHS
jgi:hypothetical protein